MNGAIAVLGAGDMAGAVTRSLVKAPVFDTPEAPEVRLTTFRSTPTWTDNLAGVSVAKLSENPGANREAVRGASFVMLGVLPEDMEEVSADIGPHLEPGAVVVSVAAAPGFETLERILPDTVGVVRTMPNLPVDIGEGVIGIARGTNVSDEQLAYVRSLLDPTGLLVVVDDEAQLDLFTAIPGGAPAYVTYFMDGMIRGAIAQGFDETDAVAIVQASFRGAIARLDHYADDPVAGNTTATREGMLQPGNITHTGLAHLEQHGVMDRIAEALAAGVARAREFSAR